MIAKYEVVIPPSMDGCMQGIIIHPLRKVHLLTLVAGKAPSGEN